MGNDALSPIEEDDNDDETSYFPIGSFMTFEEALQAYTTEVVIVRYKLPISDFYVF